MHERVFSGVARKSDIRSEMALLFSAGPIMLNHPLTSFYFFGLGTVTSPMFLDNIVRAVWIVDVFLEEYKNAFL